MCGLSASTAIDLNIATGGVLVVGGVTIFGHGYFEALVPHVEACRPRGYFT